MANQSSLRKLDLIRIAESLVGLTWGKVERATTPFPAKPHPSVQSFAFGAGWHGFDASGLGIGECP
jgi:hypothetical protein